MRFDFVTIFPRMFDPLLAEGVIARGIKQGLLDVRVWDLRDFTTDRHRSTDDEAYGGGPGMVMLAEPVLRCVERIRAEGRGSRAEGQEARVEGRESRVEGQESRAEGQGARVEGAVLPLIVMTSPQGRVFNQKVAGELASGGWVVFLCGRYEGLDHRVYEALQPQELSIGDFVISGGELPAMVVADAVGRLIEGVVGNAGSVEADSFFNGLLDYPHYTRPEELRGMRVPDILLSGHHENIRKWRKEQSLRATLAKRPDLLEHADLDAEAQRMMERIRKES